MDGLGEQHVDDIVLAVSELATSAVEHGSGGLFEVRMVRQGDLVELTVESGVADRSAKKVDAEGTGGPIPRSGRGLRIVASIADAFNINVEDGRFRAWCRFSLTA